MELSKDNQEIFNIALDQAKVQIELFYQKDVYQTHYILFLEYLRLSKMIADLQKVDYNDEKFQEVAEYVFERMPHEEILANVMTPEYFPDATEMMRYMNMSPEELEDQRSELMHHRGLWNI
jgi:hypothetical protein